MRHDSIHKKIAEEAIAERAGDENSASAKTTKSPLYYIIGLFLALILILWIVPVSIIRLDPEPRDIPSFDDVTKGYDINDFSGAKRPDSTDIRDYVAPTDPTIKQLSTRIAASTCDSGKEAYKVCQAKAVFYFVRDNFAYVAESDEYMQTPTEIFYTRGGDCDDFSVLLASMEQAIGVPTRFIRAPGHVYVQVYIEEALERYKEEDGWINLDAACRSCGFGQLSKRYDQKSVIW
ncbi:transglutaminase domain-containing protein [Candidatus Woesearchaeota archaeon]|nr:transglutaminase domain-containing protein [Candidatus Woesearchaeota archaeon]